jgi:hypothetical protein
VEIHRDVDDRGLAARGWGLFGGVDGEGPEPVVVSALGVAVGYSARLGERVFLGVQLVEEAEVVGYSEVAFLEAPERIVGFLQRPGLYKHRG